MSTSVILQTHCWPWVRRLTIFVLTVSLATLVFLFGFSAWVVAVTVPVMVVDGDGNPIPGVAVFDWKEALGDYPSSGCVYSCPKCATCVGSCLPCMPVQADASNSSSALIVCQASSASAPGGFVCGTGALLNSGHIAHRIHRVRSPPRSVVGWLHRWVRPFGVALVWDWEQPVTTGGAGSARVPESPHLTAITLGDLRAQPGQVFLVEGTAAEKSGLGPQAKIVIRPLLPIPAQLHKRVNWYFTDTPLAEFIRQIEDETGLRFHVDRVALEEEGVTLDTPITVQLGDVSLDSALKFVLGGLNLTVLVQSNAIRITSRLDAWNNRFETRLYVVSDLLTSSGVELEDDAEELQELIQETVSPNSWDSVGGAGNLLINPAERTLVVSQTANPHAELESLLGSLRTGKNPPPSEDEVRLRWLLTQPVSCDLDHMPLAAAITYIKNLVRCQNIAADRVSLEEEGVTSDTPVSLHVEGVPLGTALRLFLSNLNLTWIIKDNVLVITSQLQAGNELVHRVYPVADLLGNPPDYDILIEIIEQTIPPNTWSCVGGPATIQTFTPRSLLVINQTEAVHILIEQLLESLRTGTQPGETAEDMWIRRAMQSTISFDFRAKPLDEAVQFLAAQAGIKIVSIDRVALDEQGVRPDTPMTLRGQRISIHCALRHLLTLLNLESEVQDGVLIITNQLQAGNNLFNRIYPVTDLLGSPPDPDTVIEFIQRTISPPSWSNVGGSGMLQFFPAKRLLIVRSTARIQDDVIALLTQLRGQSLPTSPAEQSIQAGLRSIQDWSFGPKPLDQLVDRLAEGLNCTVILDRAEFEAAGLSLTEPVTIEAHNQPLDSALRRGLALIGVSFEIRDQALVLSSTLTTASSQLVRTYPVATLVRNEDRVNDLLGLLLHSVDEDSWDTVGGEAAAFFFPPTRLLVVRQTEEGHAHVKAFLAKLSAGRRGGRV